MCSRTKEHWLSSLGMDLQKIWCYPVTAPRGSAMFSNVQHSPFIPRCQPSNQRTFHSKRFSGACDSNNSIQFLFGPPSWLAPYQGPRSTKSFLSKANIPQIILQIFQFISLYIIDIIQKRRSLGEICHCLQLFMADGTLHLSQVIQTPEASRLRSGLPRWGFP